MKFLGLILAFVLVFFASQTTALSCLPCDMADCTQPVCNESGYALGICGCCQVCAKPFNDSCGGTWNLHGTCDKNLTCNSTASSSFEGGVCTDVECRAIVDTVFVLDGSFAFSELGFVNATLWAKRIIRRLFERYGACAHFEIVEYAGTGNASTAIYPVTFGNCTNNNDCVERKTADLHYLNLPGVETFGILNEILMNEFPKSQRYSRSQKVIIVVTGGGTTDASLSEAWLQKSASMNIHVYATRVGARWQELVNITGSMDRVIDPSDVDDFINQIWRDTVNVSENCEYPEEFTPCKSNCEATCDDMFKTCPLSCDTRGCRCRSGYVRYSETNNTCVRYAECPAYKCSYPEVYKKCSTSCEPSCSNLNPICAQVCEPGKCECIDGYVRRSENDSTCVPRRDCSTGSCSFPEVYRECSSYCEATCSNPSPICIQACAPPKCECAEGYVKHNGTCIPLNNCPQEFECKFPRVYKRCSSSCNKTCADPAPIFIKRCDQPRCECADGYVSKSDENSTCIPFEKCSRNCSFPEVYRECSSYCEPTCSNRFPFCIQVCGSPRCQCSNGYARHNGTCIPMTACPRETECVYPRVYRECSSPCNKTCADPTPICIERCDPPRCECADGYVSRSAEDFTCIPIGQCPASASACTHQQCPMLDPARDSPNQLASTWNCELNNWKCQVEDWKNSMEEWWFNSGCYELDENLNARWRNIFTCQDNIAIDCTHQSEYHIEKDALGCKIPFCANGNYRDKSKLLEIWKHYLIGYDKKVKIYKEAVAICTEMQERRSRACHEG